MVGKKCRLCYSPLRQEIEYLIDKKVSMSSLARKYHKAVGLTEVSCVATLAKHKKKLHGPVIDETPVDEEYVREAMETPQTFDEYAKRLLGVGFKNMDPSKVSHNHVIAAQRTLLEEKKLDNEMTNQQKFMMMFFRGKPGVIEGEVLKDEPVKQLRGETIPTDTD